jgi:raffinose/stachyose/melibiose transport system substrate-binding protein
MKKKILSIVLCLTMVAGMVVGCGGKKEEAETKDGKKIISLWTIATESDSFHNAHLKAIEEYETNHPDIKIEMESFENQSYKTKIKSAVAANELPDIFYTWGGGFSSSFVESGKVLALDDYYTEYKDELPEAALKNATYDGKLYGTTYTTPVSMLFYNKAMFEEQGLEAPETFDDLLNVVKTFKAAGITPIGLSVKDTWVLAMLHDGLTLKSAGPDKVAAALTKDGQSYDDPDFLKSAELLRELVDASAFSDGATGISNDEAVAPFLAGQVPMYITGSWMGAQLASDTEDVADYDAIPIPVVGDNAKATDFMGGAVDTLMVKADTKDPDASANAVFELSKLISKYAYLDGAGIAAWNVDYDDSSVNPVTKKVADYASNATSFTLWFDTLLQAEDAQVYLELLEQLYTGDKSPEQFVAGMAEQLDK